MISQNLLISHLKKRETALKWLFFSFGYFLLFVFLENPLYETISLIGKKHSVLFAIFCFVYAVGNLINLSYMKRNFEIKNKFFLHLPMVFNASFGLVATTLMPDKSIGDVTLFATIVHWIAGFGGILVNTVSVLVVLLSLMRKTGSKKLKAVFWFCTLSGIADLLSFVIASALAGGNVQKGKNGFLEIVPMTITFFVLYIINHTDLVSERAVRDKEELNFTVRDESLFSSISFALLCFAWIMFTFFSLVRSPIHFTISMTGTDYPVGFGVTSFALAAAFTLNFIQMLKKNGCRNILIWCLSIIGSLSIIVCVLSPTKMGTELDLVHSAAALMFFYFLLASFVLYYFHFRKDKKRQPFMFSVISILLLTTAAMVLLFVVFKQKYGRTGLTEVIPLQFFFICFLLENHTEYFSREKAAV